MEMNYGGAMVLPRNYVVMNEEEMTYVEGGATYTVYGKAGEIRTRLNIIIGACIAGTITASALGGLLGTPGNVVGVIVGAAIGYGLGDAWFGTIKDYASSAHSKVERIIQRYGKNKRCSMTSTWSTIFMTGLSVSAI